MVVYDLMCICGQVTEGWFGSPDDYYHQKQRGLIHCPHCQSTDVHKKLSAPYVNSMNLGHSQKMPPKPQGVKDEAVSDRQGQVNLSAEQLINQVVDFVLQHTEDVGLRFAEEARRIHREHRDNDKTSELTPRWIRGVASAQEVVELAEEGIDCVPIPIPAKKQWH